VFVDATIVAPPDEAPWVWMVLSRLPNGTAWNLTVTFGYSE
jgi:hypothetical protein